MRTDLEKLRLVTDENKRLREQAKIAERVCVKQLGELGRLREALEKISNGDRWDLFQLMSNPAQNAEAYRLINLAKQALKENYNDLTNRKV